MVRPPAVGNRGAGRLALRLVLQGARRPGGRCLLGPADFIAEARLWRRRQGGTVYHLTAEAVSALAGLQDQLPIVADTVAWARAFAAELPPFIAVQPAVPHANQFLVYAAGDADAVNERVLALIEEHHIGFPAWHAAQEPGRITTEFAVSRAALKVDPDGDGGAGRRGDRAGRRLSREP